MENFDYTFKGNKKHGLGRYIGGLSGSSIRINFVNSLIIMLKYIIFKSRITDNIPSFNKIQIFFFIEYINAEKKLATTRGKLGKHLLKWEHIN